MCKIHAKTLSKTMGPEKLLEIMAMLSRDIGEHICPKGWELYEMRQWIEHFIQLVVF